ncbi:MAG: CvpA family protein [Anaerolineae bacterium]|nr:CvpA family protein [Anaerolineae bacterium]
MNWLDLLLFLIVIGTMLWGMFRGAVRQLIGLFGLYVAVVASLWLYPSLAVLVGALMPNLSESGRETIAFLFLFILISNIVSAMVRSFFVTPPEERKRKKPRDQEGITDAMAKTSERFILAPLNLLGGMFFALISTCVWISLLTAVLRHALVVPWLAYDGIRAFLLDGLVQSGTMVLFDGALRIIYTSVSPWVPRTGGELPSIFSGQL